MPIRVLEETDSTEEWWVVAIVLLFVWLLRMIVVKHFGAETRYTRLQKIF